MLECWEQRAHPENNQHCTDCQGTYTLLSSNFNKSHCGFLSGEEKKPTLSLDNL